MSTLRTVTLSTGFDDHYSIDGFEWGGLGRMAEFRSVPSGKGVSCARAALGLGLPVRAYAVVGAEDAADYQRRVDAEGLALTLVEVPGRTRHNLTLIDATGRHTGAHFMADRPPLDPDDVAPLFRALLADVQPGDIVTLNGAVPPGLPASTWASLVRELVATGAEVVVDAQGEAFVACLDGPPITAFKPNADEIAALPGIQAAAEPVTAALHAMSRVARVPMVSLGKNGVALLHRGEVLQLACPVERPVVSVMAGDAFVAGVAWALLDGRTEPEQVARHGLAAAAAYVAGAKGAELAADAAANLERIR